MTAFAKPSCVTSRAVLTLFFFFLSQDSFRARFVLQAEILALRHLSDKSSFARGWRLLSTTSCRQTYRILKKETETRPKETNQRSEAESREIEHELWLLKTPADFKINKIR